MVVVRGRPHPDGPVVAGVDESTAIDRGAGPVVVRYAPAMHVWVANVCPADVRTPEQDAVARSVLEEQLPPWRGKFHEVPVDNRMTHEGIALVLASTTS